MNGQIVTVPATAVMIRCSGLASARDNHYAGILIAIQADVLFAFELSDGGNAENFLPSLEVTHGYSDLFYTLSKETHNYAGQVVLVHGDSHYFKLD